MQASSKQELGAVAVARRINHSIAVAIGITTQATGQCWSGQTLYPWIIELCSEHKPSKVDRPTQQKRAY
jgi:hypothetical protein